MIHIQRLLLLIVLATVEASRYDHPESRLLSDLFGSSYDRRARPPFRPSDTVLVDFRLELGQIYEVNERAQTISLLTDTYQEWREPRLVWNSSDYNGLESVSIFYANLWTPDTTLHNTVDMYRQNVEDRGNAVVINDGSKEGALVLLMYNTRHTIGCRFDMRYFPFDQQNCTYIFGAWTHDESQIMYNRNRTYVTYETFKEHADWTLVGFNITHQSVKYECCKIPYHVMFAHLVIRRKCLYYVFNLVLPTIIINVMASFSLFASPGNASNRNEKLQIGITTLLSYCILLLAVSDQIPRGSTSIPLISWFFLSVMLQHMVIMYVAVFLSYANRRECIKKGFRYVKELLKGFLRRGELRKRELRTDETTWTGKCPPIDEEEDRWLETISSWISVAVLGIITLITFAVAYSQ